jgi:hypothetical protein
VGMLAKRERSSVGGEVYSWYDHSLLLSRHWAIHGDQTSASSCVATCHILRLAVRFLLTAGRELRMLCSRVSS